MDAASAHTPHGTQASIGKSKITRHVSEMGLLLFAKTEKEARNFEF